MPEVGCFLNFPLEFALSLLKMTVLLFLLVMRIVSRIKWKPTIQVFPPEGESGREALLLCTEPLPSTLHVFTSQGGLSLLAQHMSLLYPDTGQQVSQSVCLFCTWFDIDGIASSYCCYWALVSPFRNGRIGRRVKRKIRMTLFHVVLIFMVYQIYIVKCVENYYLS